MVQDRFDNNLAPFIHGEGFSSRRLSKLVSAVFNLFATVKVLGLYDLAFKITH